MTQPTTLTEFIKALQGYESEMPKPHEHHGDISDKLRFYFEDAKGEIHSLKIKDIDATRVHGCGCWTGCEITFEEDND